MQVPRRQFVIGGAAAGLLSTACWPASGDLFTPEAFGAKGDGRTNDTDAFAAMSDQINARGGGTVVLRPVTYIVGKHVASSKTDPLPYAYAPATIMHFVGCSRGVTLQGNGAVLRCQPGLRYGTFDPRTGRATNRPTPNYKRDERASPYVAMIRAEKCSGAITISDLELDGNLERLVIGGKFGNAGWQITGYGIQLIDNSGPERLSRINSHHHAHDGLLINGPNSRTASSLITDLTCDYNGRQGCSITGGRNYAFERCKFRHTGKVVFRSLPGAGVDIEAEKKLIRNISFSECEFSNNAGPGLLAPVGDSEGVSLNRCTLLGTTSWAAWPSRPGYRFNTCMFVGAIARVYSDADHSRSTQFHGCTFRDDPALSPTGRVFTGNGPRRPIVHIQRPGGALFSKCRFALTHDATLPFSGRAALYEDCEMVQASPQRSRPAGTYLGTNRISGNADLAGSLIRGTLILNGRLLAPGEVPPNAG